jgi:DNA-binding transcriptional MocR family regulator
VDEYRLLADQLAADIAAGRLRAGERLEPQRRFARRRGIASSTAARVYGELIQRGLAVGEVGRGTFVRAGGRRVEPALAEPGEHRIDLEQNFPILPEQAELQAAGLARMLRSDVLAESLRPARAVGAPEVRQAASAHLARAGWQPDPDRIHFAGNGRQAVAAAVAALVPAGGRLGVEALTYPVVKGIADRLNITLSPLAMDEYGLVPEAVAEGPPRAVYLQPALHNPVGTTMPPGRRLELVAALRQSNSYAIEDAVYGFLRDDLEPLAASAPERTIVVDSLSKRLAPGLTLGFVVTPPGLEQRVASALRSGPWLAAQFALEAATQWMVDGTASAVEQAKRVDASERQQLRAERLAGFAVDADPAAYHCWWRLPEPWRAETFVAAAARRGIAMAPAAVFAVRPGAAPNAVRLALATPGRESLAGALDVLAELARGTPEDAAVE